MAQAIIFQSILTALFIVGISISLQDGMIFGFVRRSLDKFMIPDLIAKPLYDCAICMSSVWSVTVYYLIYGSLSWYLLLIIPCTAGLMVIVSPVLDEFIFIYQRHRTNGL